VSSQKLDVSFGVSSDVSCVGLVDVCFMSVGMPILMSVAMSSLMSFFMSFENNRVSS
jgi:hypothetical protein